MDFKSYPNYKDSGVEWLGEVPEHWQVANVKRSTYLKGRVGWKGLTSNEFELESYAYLVTGTDFKNKYVEWSSCYQVNEDRFNDDPYIQLKNDDLLITKDGTIGKLAVVRDLDKPACLNSGIFLIRPEKYYLSEYMYYILKSSVFQKFFEIHSTGSTILHLYQNVFEKFSFAYPSFYEQTQIVSFLDSETSRIDNLIAKQEKLIEKLEEYRKSVISHAVTRGLDPNAKMKDSGVEWLGEVPEHWIIGRLKNLVQIKNGSDYKHIEAEKSDSSYPVYGSGGVFTYASDFMYDKESILLGRKGTIDKPLYVTEPFWAVDTMFYTKIKKNAVGKFVYYQALGFPFGKYSSNTALPSMTQTDLLNLAITIPSVEEQNEIIQFIIEKCLQIDELINKQKELIAKLKEYRTSIISHAVTGKIDVRDLVA